MQDTQKVTSEVMPCQGLEFINSTTTYNEFYDIASKSNMDIHEHTYIIAGLLRAN